MEVQVIFITFQVPLFWPLIKCSVSPKKLWIVTAASSSLSCCPMPCFCPLVCPCPSSPHVAPGLGGQSCLWPGLPTCCHGCENLQEPPPCSPAVSHGPHPKPTIHHHPVKKWWWEEYILNKKHFSSKHSNVSEWELSMLTDGAATLPQPQAALIHTWINTIITLSQKCLQINWQGNSYFLNMQSNCCILSLMDISGGCKMQLINPFSSSPLYSLLSYSSSRCVCGSATSKLGCLHAAFSRCAKQII